MTDGDTGRFISHASADGAVAADLGRLEVQGVPVWVDSRSLRGGDALVPKIEAPVPSRRCVRP